MTSSDSYYRTAMVWDNENLPDITVEGIKAEENELGGVEQQIKDDHSLLNTYRKLIKLRLQNPEIARGNIEEVLNFGDNNVGGMIINYNGSRVIVIHNTSQEAKELTIDMIDSPELRGWSYGDLAEEPIQDKPKLSGTALSLPARTSVVIKENQ